ncbi:diphthamide biosynthesis enzyme Dph2 [Candidatus Bathyarchaeota archaeon]|nr:MAG: diphthamide biosynthesis enzyme Dph2 [Candidatus Bathyarchaeota archaeon]
MRGEIFDLEEERLRSEIRRHGARRVLLQLPEGLKPQGLRLASIIEDAGATAIISGDPCYGACDIAISEAKELNADLIIHYGHSKMLSDVDVPVVYFEAYARIPIGEAVRRSLGLLKRWSRIGLATTIQHIKSLNEARRILSSEGKTVYVGGASHMLHPGQVLGCDYANAKAISPDVEAFLFIGGGRFHPLGLALATMKPVVAADPFTGRAYRLDDDARRLLGRRWAEIEEAGRAETIGVIVGLKPGQRRLGEALRVRDELARMGKSAHILAMREITPESLENFTCFGAFVNTACPRVSLDADSAFPRPVLTLREAYVMLGKLRWRDLLRNGII